jgi:hypothetical protein
MRCRPAVVGYTAAISSLKDGGRALPSARKSILNI